MACESVHPEDSIAIENIISIHYFQYMSDFSFLGESHDFWGLVCVDHKEMDAITDDRRLTLKKGSTLFHKPDEFHNVFTSGLIPPSLMIAGFDCYSPCMRAFENQLMAIQDTGKELLAQIVVEARNAFDGRLNDPYQEKLVFPNHPVSFGSAQLISHYLEQLIIHLYRRYFSYPLSARFTDLLTAKSGTGSDTYNQIVRYIEGRTNEQLTIDKICKGNLVERSRLQKLFQDTRGYGVIEFFSMMRVDTAKQIIRDHQLNFTQISDKFEYTSIHYFSRWFKKLTVTMPSECATSIQLLSEKP